MVMRAMFLAAVAVHVLPAQERAAVAPLRNAMVCVRDAATLAPVSSVRVQETHVPSALLFTSTDGCASLGAQTERTDIVRLTISRIGFTAQTVAHRSPGADQRVDTVFVLLQPIAAQLATTTVVAATPLFATASQRNAITVNADSARALGVASTGALVALLPYTFPRSARGEVTLSLRGARREQVAVTLDGIALSDPATGLADLSDVPLAVLGSATVSPGSDALNSGPGASGGVLNLASSSASIASVRLAAFGDVLAEGAWGGVVNGLRLRVGGSHRIARNDFPFANNASTTGTLLNERRVNNDVLRTSALVQLETKRTQLFVLASRASLGLVGPVNVRDYDEDRSQTTRVFSRATLQSGQALLSLSARAFSLAFRDPARPAFNSLAEAIATDLDARRSVRGVLLHAGVGGDALRASQDIRQQRGRAFAAAQTAREALGLSIAGGARVDLISGSGLLPSLSITTQRTMQRVAIGARVGQAVRVPTLYDLYFSSPQRLSVRALQPERVVLDAELFARWRPSPLGDWRVSADMSLVARDTRNAIVWFPGNFGWSPANVGREQMHGVETRVAFERARVSLNAWSTLYAPTLVSGALRIPTPYVPAHAGGGNAQARLGPVLFGVAARVLGERPFTAGPRDPAFMLPAVALLDASLSTHRAYRHTDVMLSISADNLTNRAWQSVRGFPSPGRAWSVAFTLRPVAP